MTKLEFLSNAIVEVGKSAPYMKVFKVMENFGGITRCESMYLSESDAEKAMSLMSQLYPERVYFVIFDLVF